MVKEHSSLKKLDDMIKKLETDVRFLKGFISSVFQYKGIRVQEARIMWVLPKSPVIMG